MSFSLASLVNTIVTDVSNLFFHTRNIGGIIPDVTIEEQQTDRLTITQHPVATGTPVSDHAYMMPPTVTMRCGWTNAGSSWLSTASDVLQGATSQISAIGGTRIKDIYNALLDLQRNAEPFTLTTGKRTYQNMLISSLSVRTDEKLEYTLMLECEFQQVLRVSTATTTMAQSSQSMPEKTAGTSDVGGTTQPQPRVSILSGTTGHGAIYNPATPSTQQNLYGNLRNSPHPLAATVRGSAGAERLSDGVHLQRRTDGRVDPRFQRPARQPNRLRDPFGHRR